MGIGGAGKIRVDFDGDGTSDTGVVDGCPDWCFGLKGRLQDDTKDRTGFEIRSLIDCFVIS